MDRLFLVSDQKRGYQKLCFASMDINIPIAGVSKGKELTVWYQER